MLRKCASGYTTKLGPHKIRVMYQGRTYPSLPTGHKGDRDPEIYVGQIKQLARQLGIEECAKAFFGWT